MSVSVIDCWYLFAYFSVPLQDQRALLMDDLDLINSVEQVEVMVYSTLTGAQNQKTSALVMLENLLGVFLICSTLFRSKSNLHEYAARLRGASTR